MLSADARDDTSNTRVRLEPDERLSMNELYLQGGVSSSLQDDSATLAHNVHIEESSSSPTAVIITNGNESNDDPPPYSAIKPPDHIGWPYGLFSFGNSYSTDGTTPMEIPLTPFQTFPTYLTPTTNLHSEIINGEYASYPMSLMPYQYFKFDYHRNSFVPREIVDEKVDDKKSRSEHG